MSDDGRVISEDIDYISNDGSDIYHASAETFDRDDCSDVKSPERKNRVVESRKLGRNKNASEDKDQFNVLLPIISRVNSSSDYELNDYSAEFDDTSAQSNGSILYSNDFEFDGEMSNSDPLRRGQINSRSKLDRITIPHHWHLWEFILNDHYWITRKVLSGIWRSRGKSNKILLSLNYRKYLTRSYLSLNKSHHLKCNYYLVSFF